MNIYLKTATAALLLGTSVAASSSELSKWVADIDQRIDRSLDPAEPRYGTVTMRFHRGDDGRATNVAFVAGNVRLRDCAEKAIAGIGVLPPLPVGYAPSTGIVMKLIVGPSSNFGQLNSAVRMAQEVRQARREEAAHNAEMAQRYESNTKLASMTVQ